MIGIAVDKKNSFPRLGSKWLGQFNLKHQLSSKFYGRMVFDTTKPLISGAIEFTFCTKIRKYSPGPPWTRSAGTAPSA